MGPLAMLVPALCATHKAWNSWERHDIVWVIMMLAVGWLLQGVLHVGQSGGLCGCSRSSALPLWQILRHLDAFTVSGSRVAGLMLHALSVALRTSFHRLHWPLRDRRPASSSRPKRRALGIYISHTRHVAGPTQLRCYDDGPHACDVEAVEGLGVWDFVFPQIFRRWHLQLFQLLEIRAASGSRL